MRDLAPVLAAAAIRSPTTFSWEDELVAADGDDAADPDALPPVVAALQRHLYSRFYCRSAGTPLPPRDGLAARDLVHRLSNANSGRGAWERSWLVDRLDDDGRVVVRRDGLSVWARPAQFRPDGGALVPGAAGRLAVGKELRGVSPGFYLALGDAEEDPPLAPSVPLVRIYFHLTAPGAEPFIAGVTRALNQAAVPFRAKTLSEPRAYVRADAGVVYVGRPSYERAAPLLRDVHRRLRRFLRRVVPRFARALAPGLGLAEDPRTGDSFGQHRCRLVAVGLWRAFAAGQESARQRGAAVAEAFVEAGLDPRRTHLGPGSPDDYDFPWAAP